MKAIITRPLLAIALTATLGGTAFAIQQATLGAEEPNPIIEQVGQHEERIGTLETRADQTDAKVEQNSADIQVIQQETGIAPAAPRAVSGGSTTATSAPATVAEPVAHTLAPEPPKNPRLIMAVQDTPTTPGMHSCDYALYDPNQNVTSWIQPVETPCYVVGEVLPYV